MNIAIVHFDTVLHDNLLLVLSLTAGTACSIIIMLQTEYTIRLTLLMYAFLILLKSGIYYTGVPETVDSASIQMLTDTRCNANKSTTIGSVSLEWSQPNDTGGQGVDIEYYVLNVTGPTEYICPADQCNVTTTNTTITGLLCNTSYTVTVRAVNCIGESKNSSQPILINSSLSIIPEGTHIFSSYCTCIQVSRGFTIIAVFTIIVIVSSTPASLLLFSTATYTPEVSSPSSILTSTTDGSNTTDITTTTQYTQSKTQKTNIMHLSES